MHRRRKQAAGSCTSDVRTLTLLASFAATTLVIAGCGSPSTSEPSAAPTATSATATSSTAVPPQLQFTAKTVDGQEFSGASLVGKPAVLWFWAPWCPICQREAPMVGRVAAAHPAVTFVGVAALDQLPAMQHFVDTYPVKGFRHLADADEAVWGKFGVTQQPAYAFVSANGSVVVVKGSLSEADLTGRVTALSHQ